jgi:hypothetical protein
LPPADDATSATHTIAVSLLTMGDTPAAVAELMRTFGCCGRAKDPADNPLTNFMAQNGIRGAEVAWNGRGYICRTGAYEQDVAVPLPDPVAMFMAQFDAGQWPDLNAR